MYKYIRELYNYIPSGTQTLFAGKSIMYSSSMIFPAKNLHW